MSDTLTPKEKAPLDSLSREATVLTAPVFSSTAKNLLADSSRISKRRRELAPESASSALTTSGLLVPEARTRDPTGADSLISPEKFLAASTGGLSLTSSTCTMREQETDAPAGLEARRVRL